jgi:hypothetical protein
MTAYDSCHNCFQILIIIEPTIEPTIETREPKQRASRSSGESNDDAFIWHLTFICNTHNSYLNLTDKYLLPDYSITEGEKKSVHSRRFMFTYFTVFKLCTASKKEFFLTQSQYRVRFRYLSDK